VNIVRHPRLVLIAFCLIQLASGGDMLSSATAQEIIPPPKRAEQPNRERKVVLIAGKKSHGPGVHEYEKSVRLLKVLLDTSPSLRGVQAEYHLDGWPRDPRTLDDADTIMVISDGQDGDKFSPVPFMTPERMQVMEKQMRRGCGLMTFHFSTFTPDKLGPQALEWVGGYFDWQNDKGDREWYSAIRTLEADLKLGAPQHPVLRGVPPFRLRDEFYYRIRFRDGDQRLRPLVLVPELAKFTPEQVVAWAVERADGGRGFGTTMGHFFDNWQNQHFRKLILNALVWTAGGEVPAGGVDSHYYTEPEVELALTSKPIQAAIVTGHQHPAHDWRATTKALEDVLRGDPRVRVSVATDPEEFFTRQKLAADVLVFNYCNWQRPGLSDKAKAHFIKYLEDGGGLVLVHFANGAFHFSLPGGGDWDWPEYRRICRRVWDHKGKSGHDAFGKFRVDIPNQEHPITKGMQPFETVDELYFRQAGDEPIEVLATARSKVTGQDEPMAFVYRYGRGRVFQTVLGHSADSLRTAGASQLIRRAAAWSSGRELVRLPSASAAKTATVKE
jgi:type 1 glutamine amidotransferase